MINAKAELIHSSYANDFRKDLDDFLNKIDVRQIVKMEYSTTYTGSSRMFSVLIMYISMEDVRTSKIEGILGN